MPINSSPCAVPSAFVGPIIGSAQTVFVVVPLTAGFITNRVLIKKHGEDWFKTKFLPHLKPVSILALLITLVLLFAFQGKNILSNPFIILLIAVFQTILILQNSGFISYYRR